MKGGGWERHRERRYGRGDRRGWVEQRAGMGRQNKEYCEERRRWEKRRLGRMRAEGRLQKEEREAGNPRGGVGEDGVERPRKGQKRDMQRHREEMLEKTQGTRAMGRRRQEGSKILRQKGREER